MNLDRTMDIAERHAIHGAPKPAVVPRKKPSSFVCADCKVERPGNVRRTVSRPGNYRTAVCSTCARVSA